jgi:uncharacterized protein (TIGR03435 family)
MKHRLVTLMLVLASGVAGFAQRPAVHFDVASVKPGDPNDVRNSRDMSPGQYSVTNISVTDVIAVAFNVPPERIVNVPDWAGRERFTITARMPDGAPLVDRPKMVEALLVERFKLRAHIETRERSGYELIVSRQDGRLGDQVKRSATDCMAPRGADSPLASECKWTAKPGRLEASGVSMALVAAVLAAQIRSDVVDRTGLPGVFDLSLTWARDSLGAPRPGATQAAVEGPTIFTAVQEQLGLKLNAARLQTPQVVIENLERPESD